MNTPTSPVPATSTSAPVRRYAVYFAPDPQHPLWQAGCEWLQRDPRHAPDGKPPARAHITEPWRYGFHATLKPPMRLAAGRDEKSLLEALTTLAQQTRAFEMPALSVQTVAGFLALCPTTTLAATHPLPQLAERCVTGLEFWRAPLQAADLQRRLAQPLDARQRVLLERYGYPHVLERWRFHMTLSDTLPDTLPNAHTLRTELASAAQHHFSAALAVPLRCDAVCLYIEAAPGAPFQLHHRVPLSS